MMIVFPSTSSNSSFTKCVRKHNMDYSFPSNQQLPTLSNAETCTGTQKCFDGKIFKQTADLVHNIEKGPLVLNAQNYPSITSFVFTSCKWDRCSAQNGGAIYVTTSNYQLEVKRSQFLSCQATGQFGGGIYAQPASLVHVDSSCFYNCQCKGTGGDDGGGGICVHSISTEVILISTDFLSCAVQADAGGVTFRNSHSTLGNEKTFQNCRFISCSGQSDGGAVLAWGNDYNAGFTNIIFHSCSSLVSGAVEATLLQPVNNVVSFCFFNKNTGTYGDDFSFADPLPENNNYLLQSFTTTTSRKVGDYSGRAWKSLSVNCLLHSYNYVLECENKPNHKTKITTVLPSHTEALSLR